MPLFTEARTAFGTNKNNSETRDPIVVTPPRKHSPIKDTTTPATPRSKSTPLHKRFLDEVTMSPGTPSTPPRTPSRSPTRGPAVKQTLEVGQNGFYFSIEIPEKKITPRKVATPDGRALGGRSPSPLKEKKSEAKGGGRVRDILRKNLFGTPTKKGLKSEPDVENDDVIMANRGVRMNPSTIDEVQSANAQHSTTTEVVTEQAVTSSTSEVSSTSKHPSAPPPSIFTQSSMPPKQQQQQSAGTLSSALAPALDAPAMQKAPAASTPSDIGHLMAGLGNKSLKLQVLSTTTGLETMPSPLRKMSERLGLSIQHVVHTGKVDGVGNRSAAPMSTTKTTRTPVLALRVRDAATSEDGSAAMTVARLAPGDRQAMRGEDALAQVVQYATAVASPVVCSRPSTATSASFTSPSTPSRPDLGSRSKSFGTPARVRSSIQEDMLKVQESLKKSLGQDFTLQTNAKRPATPASPTPVIATPNAPSTGLSRSSVKKAPRPVSMMGPSKLQEVNITPAVPRRLLNTAARKPRPKSMIVGSAKMLETIAAQIDSPRERAKLRSTATTPPTPRAGPTPSRPSTAASTSRGQKATPTPRTSQTPHPTIRTKKSAALRTAAAQASPAAPAAPSGPQTQRVASAEAIATQVAAWNAATAAPAPTLPARTKSTKRPRATAAPAPKRTQTPEPKDPRADSGTALSYTPPGAPSRLPSPAKMARLGKPAETGKPGRVPLRTPGALGVKTAMETKTKTKLTTAHPPSHAAQLRAPTKADPPKTPQLGPKKTGGVPRGGELPAKKEEEEETGDEEEEEADRNALRTPSRAIQGSLDAAIDRKIEEDRARRGGWV